MSANMTAEMAIDLTAPVKTATEYRADRLMALIDYLELNSNGDFEEWKDENLESLDSKIEAEIEELGLED